MATKNSRKNVATADGVAIAPELTPRDTDIKYTGGEPVFLTQPEASVRKLELVRSMNWYSRYFDRKQAKEFFVNYADAAEVGSSIVKRLRSVHEREYNIAICWLARMTARGLKLTSDEQYRVGDHLQSLLALADKSSVVEEVTEEKPASNRPNVQEIMRERAREAAGEIEGLFDGFLINGEPDPTSVNVVGILTERNVLAQHVPMIVDLWRRRREEYLSVQAGEDKDLKEGYAQYTKIGIRNLIKFCDSVLSGLGSYISVKKTSKTPRKRKAVPVERVVAKVKYCRTFKDAAQKIDLTSIHPSKIVGATEVWAYDVAKRKLHYYVADSHVGTLSVKGTTILGFDTAQSGMKTLRKPGEQLKKIMAAGKPAARKFFKEIAAVQAVVKGRTSDDFVILKAY